ncbi:MAG: hypothetical protein HY906_21355 [Deltaproteobacteria bacterium]|nr:hypothetical protein [Deltaproteobacteria bacterium]
MGDFQKRLEQHPAPKRLGDIELRFEPSMLIGETARGLKSWRPTAASALGVALVLLAVGLLITGVPEIVSGLLVALAAAAFIAAVRLQRVDSRRRRFVLNFLTNSLRLDFVTPIAGKPRTLVVPFDAVRAVELLEQGDGLRCLTVDFVVAGGRELLREVLAANVPAAQAPEAERIQRVLEGAFGLGAPPPADEERGPPGYSEEDSFVGR